MRRALCMVLILCILSCVFSLSSLAEEKGEISVEPINFENRDFIKGMDISSLISLEEASVKFFDENGKEDDLLRILRKNGVNYLRVRVWNDPFDENGNSYGGGHNDIETACLLAGRAAKYGLKLLIDFHYSDFWADPAKQKAPKDWENYTVDQKCDAIREFTTSSLKKIIASGGDIGMVQIGNETTTGICGVTARADMAKLFKAGAEAVRKIDENILVALHFTNPECTAYMKGLADFLDRYQVDYDVFASSYYPYWHGSLENLKDVFDYVAETYHKYTIVAETSYAYTLEDTDGHPNTVNRWNNMLGDDLLWEFSPQGQADELRAVMNAVNSIEDQKGLGVFYWEGAWIAVSDLSGLSGKEYTEQLNRNKALWEQYGCGWASSYAKEYNPDDAGRYYGGSAVDNQAFFDARGRALPSLKAFLKISGYERSYLLGDADDDDSVTIVDATSIQKHLASITFLDEIGSLAADIENTDKVSILDATYIQRHLASYTVPYEIGGIRFC